MGQAAEQNQPEVVGRARARDIAAVATLWLPVLVVGVTATSWLDRLPADLPKQWGPDGVTSTAPTWLLLLIAVVLSLAAAVGSLLALPAGAAPNRRTIFLASGFVAGLAASVWLVCAGSTILAGSAEPEVGAWPLLAILSCGYGGIAALLASPWSAPPRTAALHDDAATDGAATDGAATDGAADLYADTEEAWSSTEVSPLFAWLAAALGLGAVGLLFGPLLAGGTTPAKLIGAATLAVIALVSAAFARIQVGIDARGLLVSSGTLGIPLRTIPLAAIDAVHADYLEALRWGGWGYRVMPGRSAVILRSGPGLIVSLTSGSQFALSLKEPDEPAGLLAALAKPA
ncbi:hypothetical protein [Cryobacterium arcticum]|uniref:DUF1648 domain-containing protein n=1 Tax=Cryobacterium arcticum TaxID=670052 RepID=A0A317ZLB9_9MICO|nr:hypothetical protein [Cryobacterium arcticum]PXA67300.1 hypothetical protein CTB96_11155 [Cryobacterium arcticum]